MSKKFLVVAALGIAVISGFVFFNCAGKQQKGSTMTNGSGIVTTPSGLKYLVIKDGEGDSAKTGRMVSVHYTGWLFDDKKSDFKGTKFDSSVDRGQPFKFQLGAGMVIRGWDEGVAGMKVGEKRCLIIPAHLGYGNRGIGGVIPANATLVFDVEFLG